MKKKNNFIKKIATYIFLIVFGFLMIYPLLWMVSSSFKKNSEIFGSLGLMPTIFNFNAYVSGWIGNGRVGFSTFFINSFKIVIPSVAFTTISSVLVAYGFARFKFPFKKTLFILMIATLMLPTSVLTIPNYMLFRNFHWIDTYLPFIVPSALGNSPFFIFLLVQFFRGMPKELDEAATIDGCNSLRVLVSILLPLCKPAIFSVAIFKFLWTWNDFFGSLIYINTVTKYPVSLGLRMSIDTTSAIEWNQILAMSVIAMMPVVLVFFLAQKYFVEGIATTGIKG